MSQRRLVHPLAVTLFLASAASLSAGCALRSEAASSTGLAAAGDDSLQTETNLESVVQSFVGGSGGQVTIQSASALSPVHGSAGGAGIKPEDLVTNPAGGFYLPDGCLVEDAATSGDSATFTFSDCTGPFGLAHLSGVVDVRWTVTAANAVSITLTSSDFKINQANVSSWSATADVTATGEARTMVWSANLTGTTGSGRPFVRSNDKTLSWTVGGSCLAIHGTSTGTVTGLDLQTTISDYSVCAGACPAAGSEIHVEDLKDLESVDLKYLGGPSAQFTGVGGGVTDLPLACGL